MFSMGKKVSYARKKDIIAHFETLTLPLVAR